VMRLKAILKRTEKIIENKVIIWEFEINFSKSKISPHPASPKGEEYIDFPHKQYLIIEFLAKNKWFPIAKIKLMEYVWWEAEENLEFNSATLESHIYAIRKKLWKQFIKTIKWVGYIIE
jgi:DNA-binding response OmpR family regulator